MSTLHVRNIPDHLYSKIQNMADRHQQSLSAEVVALLDRAVSDSERWSRQKGLLDNIRRNRFIGKGNIPSAEELLREDRER